MAQLLFGDCMYGTTKLQHSNSENCKNTKKNCPLERHTLEECGLEDILNQSLWKGLLPNGCIILISDSSNSPYLVGSSIENLHASVYL